MLDDKLETILLHNFNLNEKEIERIREYGNGSFSKALRRISYLPQLSPDNKDSGELARQEIINFIINSPEDRWLASNVHEIYKESCSRNRIFPVGRNTFYKALVGFGVNKYNSTGNQQWLDIPGSVRTIWRDKEFEGEVEFTFNLHNYDEEIL